MQRWFQRGLVFCVLAVSAVQSALASTATVTVDASSMDATVPAAGYGMNTAVWDNDLIDPTVPELMSADGITALRFPGGSYSDLYHWATNEGTAGSGIYIISNDTFQNWMDTVALPLGAHPIITVNYGSNAAGTGGGDPTEAAAWVKYANVTHNYNITYWEIGNEVYGNGFYDNVQWEEDLHSSHSPTTYGTNALTYIADMKAVDPAIKCGVVLTAYKNWPDAAAPGNPSPAWNPGVLEACGSKIDFVILHWYPGAGAGTGTASALAQPSSIASIVAATRAEINEYCGSNAPNVEIVVTETNDLDGDQMDCSMFDGDDYLSWLENGVQNVDLWNLHQTYLASGVSGVANNTQDAEYWGIKMATLTARPGDNLVASSSSNSLLRVHATRRTDGSVGLLLMNEDPNNSDTVSVSIAGVTLSVLGTQYTFGPSHFGSTAQYTTDGPTQSSLSGVGNNFSITVPAYSETSVIIPAGSPPSSGSLPTFTMSSSATPTVFAPDLTTQVTATLTDTGAALTNGSVVLCGVNPSGNIVTTQRVSGQSFAAKGGSHSYTWTWTAPGAPGTYKLMVGVYDSTGQILYFWQDAANITVANPSPALDTAYYNFETSTQNWFGTGGMITGVAQSTAEAYAGTHSLAVNITAKQAQTQVVYVNAPPIRPPGNVYFHVFVPANSPITSVRPYVMGGAQSDWKFIASSQAVQAGQWMTIYVSTGNLVAPVYEIGVEFTASGSAASFPWTGQCYVDTVSW